MVFYLIQSCNQERLYQQDGVEVLNVEEDMYGADVITYVCPDCGDTHKSNCWRS